MEIKFTEGFFKSLKSLVNRQRWYWKIWDFIRYDLPTGIKNIFFFWKVIWKFRDYDSTFQMRILARSLEPLADCLKDGNEVAVTRLKKIEKIQRAIEILNNHGNDSYIEVAEKQLGYEVDSSHFFIGEEPVEVAKANSKIFKLADELETAEWEELFEILKGQPHSEYVALAEEDSKKEDRDINLWTTWYDGSGLKYWWH
jgi:hypothetical protein